MIRRSPLRLAIVTAAAALAVSGCATFTNTDVLAEVGGSDITNDEFEVIADDFFANPEIFGTSPSVGGRADGEQSRSLLGAMVRERIVTGFLDREGIDGSESRQEFLDTALAGSPVAEMSEGIQNLIATIDEGPRSVAVSMAEVPNIDELRSLYADNPVTTGLVCSRHILVETEDEAEAVLDELRDGADFAEIAIERSIDPTATETGGALASQDNPCIPVQTMLASFDTAFVAGVLTAREGVPSAPTESSFGWHVILHRPWEEVGEAIGSLHQPGDSGLLLFDGFAATTEVEIDPRFGTWDPVLSTIVPIG